MARRVFAHHPQQGLARFPAGEMVADLHQVVDEDEAAGFGDLVLQLVDEHQQEAGAMPHRGAQVTEQHQRRLSAPRAPLNLQRQTAVTQAGAQRAPRIRLALPRPLLTQRSPRAQSRRQPLQLFAQGLDFAVAQLCEGHVQQFAPGFRPAFGHLPRQTAAHVLRQLLAQRVAVLLQQLQQLRPRCRAHAQLPEHLQQLADEFLQLAQAGRAPHAPLEPAPLHQRLALGQAALLAQLLQL